MVSITNAGFLARRRRKFVFAAQVSVVFLDRGRVAQQADQSRYLGIDDPLGLRPVRVLARIVEKGKGVGSLCLDEMVPRGRK